MSQCLLGKKEYYSRNQLISWDHNDQRLKCIHLVLTNFLIQQRANFINLRLNINGLDDSKIPCLSQKFMYKSLIQI